MPSYGGNSGMFGQSVQMRTVTNPVAEQRNAYFGINGEESLYGGRRGRFSEGSGVLIGTSVADLASYEIVWDSFRDGIARVLVDSYNISWVNVLLDTFQPQGRIRQDSHGNFLREYKFGFRHLS